MSKRFEYKDNEENISRIKSIDFGEIDGYGDPNLDEYFLDNDYWNKIVEENVFFVLGRKGTGKSSIYRMISEFGISQGYIIENKDFGEFPFERLLKLDDSDFQQPNQYQTIWKNIILNIFAKTISENPLVDDNNNTHFTIINDYAKVCLGNLVDMHKEVVSRASKISNKLSFKLADVGSEKNCQITIGNGSNNISAINSTLYSEMVNYFMTCTTERKIIIQFDRLDDNYNQYQDLEQYYNSIISLFKVVYQMNQEFRSKNINGAKVILYLRTDIMRELGKRDAESARWDDFSFEINWSIVTKTDWENPMLLKMINKRISRSLPQTTFKDIFDNKAIDLTNFRGDVQDVFKYIIERTMHRPRDIIQFCKCIQKEVSRTEKLYFRTIKDAEKAFGYWLINSELANEINPILKNSDVIYEMLKCLGRDNFSYNRFEQEYEKIKEQILIDANKLAFYLYDIGVFLNIDDRDKPVRIYSSFRNKGRFDKRMKIRIHPGVWVGLNA